MKEQLYKIIADSGIWFLYKFFPEYFAKEPLKYTDRYYEYPWALKHIYTYTKKAVMLDVGSAGSMFPLLAKSFGNTVFSTDIRKINYHGITCFNYNICSTPFQSKLFDIVTAISTIEHIGLEGRYGVDSTDSDIKAVNEIKRILRPNGIFLLSIPYASVDRKTKFHRVYSERTIKSLLNGFKLEIDIEKSPENEDYIAMIKAIKL